MKTWRRIKLEKFSQGRNNEIGSIGVKDAFCFLVKVKWPKACDILMGLIQDRGRNWCYLEFSLHQLDEASLYSSVHLPKVLNRYPLNLWHFSEHHQHQCNQILCWICATSLKPCCHNKGAKDPEVKPSWR